MTRAIGAAALTVTLLGCLHIPIADAATITGRSSCGSLVKTVDGGDNDKIVEIRILIENLLDKFDQVHVQNGEFSVLAPLSDDGLVSMVAMVSVNCRNHLKETVEGSAGDVYRGTRDIRRTLLGDD